MIPRAGNPSSAPWWTAGVWRVASVALPLLAPIVTPLVAQTVRGGDAARRTTARVATARAISATAVVDAAARGDLAAVKAALAQRADVQGPQGDGMTALHWAAERGDAAMTALLLQAGASTAKRTRIGGYTPLHLASRQGNAAVARALLAAGADARAVTGTGATALHLAASAGTAEVVSALLAGKADPDAREVAWGQTPLMFAAAADRAAAVEALIAGGANPALYTNAVNLTDELARQQQAARQRNEALFAALPEKQRDSIRHVADSLKRATAKTAADSSKPFRVGIAAPPTQGLTAGQIQAAISVGRTVFTADVAPKTTEQADTTDGQVAGYEATVGSLGGMTALHHAVRQGNITATVALLDGGADINAPTATDSTTPLLMAAINGHFDLAKELVARGASVTRESTAGLTPLYAVLNTQWAPRSRYPQPQSVQTQRTTHLELMSAMIARGADVNVRLKKNLWFFAFNNCGNSNCGLEMLDGTTAFWRASYSVDVDAMRLLKKAGADDTMPSFRPPQPARRRPGGADGAGGPAPLPPVNAQIDSAAKAAVPGIGVSPVHAAAGVGYGNGFAGNSHRHAPDGWMPAMKYLVEELHHDVNRRDLSGYTPLHHAAARGDNVMIEYLVSKGADVRAVARNGRTTVDMANGPVQRLRPFPETIQLLEKLGATNSHRCVSC